MNHCSIFIYCPVLAWLRAPDLTGEDEGMKKGQTQYTVKLESGRVCSLASGSSMFITHKILHGGGLTAYS